MNNTCYHSNLEAHFLSSVDKEKVKYLIYNKIYLNQIITWKLIIVII